VLGAVPGLGEDRTSACGDRLVAPDIRSTAGVAVPILAVVSVLPVLWVYGASGVGKTTVTWELFIQFVREGVAVGYVDIDQLGVCYGPPTAQHRGA